MEQSPTLSTDHMPAVIAFAQNTRDEVRFQGDGDMSGALSAQPGMKQTTYVMQTANTGANGSNVSEDDLSYTLDLANGQAVCTQYGEEVAGTLTARADSSPCADRGQNVVCLADDNGKAACDRDMCGSLKVGGGGPDSVLASSGNDFIGALCARDYKGTGNQDIGEGKLICQRVTR